MSSTDNSNVVRFNDRHVPTPVNASPATYVSLNLPEALDLWSHAVLLFRSYEWEQAVTAHRRLIKRCENIVPLARLWFNVGVIRSHLGEYFLASEAFTKAVKIRSNLAIGWYCLGMAIFQLGDFRKAKRPFQRCLNLFDEGTTSINYRPLGLDFVLEKTRVEWNVRQNFFEKNHKQMRAPMPLETHLSLNRLPAGVLFEPTSNWSVGTGFEDGGEVALSSSISSSLASSTLSSGSLSSPSPGRRTRNVLRKRSKRRLALDKSAARSLEQSTPPTLAPAAPPAVSIIGSGASQSRIKPSPSKASSLDQHKPLPPLPFVSLEALNASHKRMNVSPYFHQARKALPALLVTSAGKTTATYSMETASRSNVSLAGDSDPFTQSSALRSVEDLLEPTTARPVPTSSSSSSSSVARVPKTQPIPLSRNNVTHSSRAIPYGTNDSRLKRAPSDRGRSNAHFDHEDRASPIPRSHFNLCSESSNIASERYGTPELENVLTPAPLFSSSGFRSGSRDREAQPFSSLQTLTAARYNPQASSSRSSSLQRKPIFPASPLRTLTSARYNPNAPTRSEESQLPFLSSARYDPSQPNRMTTNVQQTLKPAQSKLETPVSTNPQLPTLPSTRYDPKGAADPASSQLPLLSSARYDPNASSSQKPDPGSSQVENSPQRVDSYAIFGLGKQAAQAAIRERDEEIRSQSAKGNRPGNHKGRR